MSQIKFIEYCKKMGGKILEYAGTVRGMVTVSLVVLILTPTLIGMGIFFTNKFKELFSKNSDDYTLHKDDANKEIKLDYDPFNRVTKKHFKEDEKNENSLKKKDTSNLKEEVLSASNLLDDSRDSVYAYNKEYQEVKEDSDQEEESKKTVLIDPKESSELEEFFNSGSVPKEKIQNGKDNENYAAETYNQNSALKQGSFSIKEVGNNEKDVCEEDCVHCG